MAGDGVLSPEHDIPAHPWPRPEGEEGRRVAGRELACLPCLGQLHQRGENALSQHQPHAVVFQRNLQGRNPLCCIRVRRHTPVVQLTRAPGSSHIPGLQQHLAGHSSCWDMSSCSSAAGGGTNTHPAHPHRPLSGGTLPLLRHLFSLSPPTCFLRFCPYFSRQKQSPSLHLRSLSRSQLFFLLFSASYYPGAKNNKEFTALDLELGQAQCSCFVLCQQSARWLILGFPHISASPFPWGHSIGMPASLASSVRDAVSWSCKRDEMCHTGTGELGSV